MKRLRVLIYDIETSPILGHVWTKYDATLLATKRHRELLSIAWKWERSKKVHYRDRKGDPSDKTLTAFVRGLLSKADISVAHNGDQFDKKVLKSRMLVHKLRPTKHLTSVDTCRAAKSYFGFTSNSLADLCEQLGIGKKTPHSGISLWLGCMDNDPIAWEKMQEYNKNDVVLLDGLYKRLKPWIENHPNLGRLLNPEARVDAVCPSCAGTNTVRNGYRVTARGVSRRMSCRGCGKAYLLPLKKGSK